MRFPQPRVDRACIEFLKHCSFQELPVRCSPSPAQCWLRSVFRRMLQLRQGRLVLQVALGPLRDRRELRLPMLRVGRQDDAN